MTIESEVAHAYQPSKLQLSEILVDKLFLFIIAWWQQAIITD